MKEKPAWVIRRKNEKYSLKTFIYSYFSMIFSLLFAIFELFTAVLSKSTWYYSLFFYHILLTGMRLANIVVIRKKKLMRRVMDENASLKLYMSNGIFLIVVNLVFFVSVYQMAFYGRNFGKPGLLVYVYAGHALYKLLTCSENMMKAYKTINYSTRAIRVINFSDALVSILAMQSALLLVFNPEPSKNGWYNLITGIMVCSLMSIFGVLMIIKAKKKLVELKEKNMLKQIEKNDIYNRKEN